jgi:hypothetical protein
MLTRKGLASIVLYSYPTDTYDGARYEYPPR